MSHVTSLLTRPATLGAIAAAGSGALYLGLKYRIVMGSEMQQGSSMKQDSTQGQEKSYEVKPGREGGGV